VQEHPLPMPAARRPVRQPLCTHITDHWAIVASFRRTADLGDEKRRKEDEDEDEDEDKRDLTVRRSERAAGGKRGRVSGGGSRESPRSTTGVAATRLRVG